MSDFCFNQNKNKLCNLHSPAFFKILQEPTTLLQKQTITHIKALLLSFLQLERQGHGITMGVPGLHPLPFLSEVVEAKWGWWNQNWMFYIKYLYLTQDPKNHWLLIRMALNQEKIFIWNESIWVQGPCRFDWNPITFDTVIVSGKKP